MFGAFFQIVPTEQRKAAAKIVGRILDREFPDPPIPLDHTDSFTFLIAVLLSAQCTDVRVNQITPILWATLGDTPQELAKAEVEAIREIIRPCGLSPAKSKAIHGLSKILLEKHAGQVPSNFADLEALPGVGHKTASVIMSQCFGVPALAIDTHIHRCSRRWGLSDGSTVEHTERDLKELYPPKRWNALHLQMIHYARKFCPARGHKPAECPICSALAAKGLPLED
ncbi:MAG: endonuclease [Fibrobacterota bacterium]|jgi:endonuclease-3